jgi:glycogen operon protein
MQYRTAAGQPHPLGATVAGDGVNFSVFSRHATGVELLLFSAAGDAQPSQIVPLDPRVNKTFHFWHVYVAGLRPGACYALRVDGPAAPAEGHRFNKNKVLLDPYARAITASRWNRVDACGEADNVASSMRGVVVDTAGYDWEGDRPLNRPMHESVIYELHVGGFTRHPSAEVSHPGTFRGVIEKIPYLTKLGVTAVELLPVFEFDETEVLRTGPDGVPLHNYWGYSTIGFFAPEQAYCVAPDDGSHVREFRDMVKALHRSGIEVILDVVFNHTNEGNHEGPTIHFKGLDNSVYYHLMPDDRQYYQDYSGCGNTVNCNHPIADKLIVDCLEYWVEQMHVDGFRFDEGTILARAEDGALMAYPPVVWNIELSETLANTKIIAEAWDAAGAYQIGYFPGYRWAEWNGRYRDDVRRFVRGDPGLIGAVASRIAGSADIYQATGHQPVNTVNFVTCHDGFTLNDLVSYDEKHNWANGEGNADGSNDNLSWNCGIEGPSDDPAVERLRDQQVKNFAAILLLSQGVPMLLSGDEVRRTQHGNNNGYCQDTELSWLDWTNLGKQPDLFQFFARMIAFRRAHPTVHRSRFFTGERNERGLPDIAWHGTALEAPDWSDPEARALSCTLAGFDGEPDVHVLLNMYWEPLDFELPTVPDRSWRRVLDTALAPPDDIADSAGGGVPLPAASYRAAGRSVVVLLD